MITILDQLPENILDVDATELYKFVDNHTLVHLAGQIKRPLFISILQHGDEATGWDAIKILIKQNINKLPRSLYILFGNVQAAKENLRQLEHQPDFNRCWPGIHKQHNDVAMKMSQITEFMANQNPFASVDIHNNTGRNPHYAGINSLKSEFINLASLFSDTIIHFTSPDGIQSGAFAKFCPSVTIECGMSGTADGIEQTLTFLENLIHQSTLESVPGFVEHRQVLNIFSTVKVKPDISIAIAGKETSPVNFVINNDLDYHNFHLLEVGTVFGQLDDESTEMPFIVTDQIGHDITDHYFEKRGKNICTKQKVVPAMITQSIRAIRLDCLCYLMHPAIQY
ncbi:M14 family metallopeptidase [Marinicella litoralis]|uniref:Succinylglutamate desuccinylase/aspartoacylase family protein n=1 Tax=Marinicella litoralis TaxID=644220 RepID=A0A4V3DHJ0_9GAMM|nr:M14 family metallopeptidase [Marinicella litoralis]TDR18401.1 succinylglutamate desuccinylase/aspartoacylase family protein [Marinicella litoralis]